MQIILDLDNTLLNTSRIKKGLAKALINIGVSEELFKKVYKKLRRKGFYNHKIYIEYLSKEKKIDRKKCLAQLKKTDDKIKNYLYPDALWFLKKSAVLRKKVGVKIILLTYGDPEFQKIKLEKTKIAKYFDKIIITETKKTPIVSKIASKTNDKIFFINDDTDEIREIVGKFKNVEVLHIKRKNRDKEIPNTETL